MGIGFTTSEQFPGGWSEGETGDKGPGVQALCGLAPVCSKVCPVGHYPLSFGVGGTRSGHPYLLLHERRVLIGTDLREIVRGRITRA